MNSTHSLLLLISFAIISIKSESILYQFGPEAYDQELDKGDKTNSPQIQIVGNFPFFNNFYTSFWVNTKGAISFINATSYFGAFDSRCNTTRKFSMIAPFWADISTNVTPDSHVYWRKNTSEADLNRTTEEITQAFPNVKSIDLKWVLVATWVNVTRYCQQQVNCDTRTNTFQAVVSTDGVRSYVLFLYDELSWDLGDGTFGDTSAQASFDLGDQKHRYALPGSCSSDVLNLTQLSNTNIPGKWIFQVDNTMIQSAGCSRGFDGTLNVFPNEIDWIGHKPVVLNGPCLNEGETAKCRFYDPNGNQSGFSMVPALIEGSDSSTKFICGTPYFYTTGRIKIELAIFNSSNIESNKYTGYINIVSPKKTGNGLKFSLSTIDANGVLMKFNWSIENFENSTGQNVVPKISIWLLKWGLGSVQNNTYILEGSKLSGDLTTENGYSNDTYITDKASFLCQVDPNNLISRIAIVAINAEYDSVDKLRPDDYFTYITGPQVDQIITYVCNNSVLAQMCNNWIQIAQPVGTLTTCPPTYNITEYDSNWISDPTCSNYNPECIYNPGADSCVIFSAANQQGSSQQCCYKDEKIFIGVPGGGRAQLYHPSISAGLKHFAYDNLGWFSCCSKQDTTLCEKFYNLRPSSTVDNNPPGISASYGEPHFVTYDGFRYTFNGLGEYWLLKNNPEQPVAFQARTEQVKSSDGISQVSGITAFVMKSEKSSKIQIQQSNIRTADIYIDDVLLDGPFDLDHELDLTGVHIKIAQNLKNFIVSFADGMTFTITPYIRAFGIEVLISSDFKGNKTSGLLGVYNGNSSDDLTLPNGTILPINSTAAEIYFNLKAWNIAENETLFYYTDGNTYDTFNGQPFSPVGNYDPSKVTPAMTALCGGDQFCLFDYVITGDPNFANETKILGNKLSETIKALQEQIPLCSMLTKPENGYVNLETYIPPVTAIFGCFDGYVLEGNTQLFCDSNSWNGIEPVCKSLSTETTTISTATTTSNCFSTCMSQCSSTTVFTTSVTKGSNPPGTGTAPTEKSTSSANNLKSISFMFILFIIWGIH